MPDLLHVIPVGDNTVLDGILQGEDITLGQGFIADISILWTQVVHVTLVRGTTYRKKPKALQCEKA
jgi:hypothetical protein